MNHPSSTEYKRANSLHTHSDLPSYSPQGDESDTTIDKYAMVSSRLVQPIYTEDNARPHSMGRFPRYLLSRRFVRIRGIMVGRFKIPSVLRE